MTVFEYMQNRMGMQYAEEFKSRKNEIIEYLKSHNDDINIISEAIDNSELIDFYHDENLLKTYKFLEIEDELVCHHYDDKTNELVKEYISRNIEKMNIPYSLFKILDLSEFKNLKELELNGYIKLNKEDINIIFKNLNFDTIIANFGLDDEVAKDSIVVDNGSIINYEGHTIKRKNIKFSSMVDVYSKDVKTDLDKILELITNEDISEVEKINIKDELGFSVKSVIEYEKKKKPTYDLETEENIDENIGTLTIRKFDSVDDIFKIIETFKKNNFNIDRIKIELENKNYDNIQLLNSLNSEYKFIIVCDHQALTVDQFVGMRETLNYYKDLITSYELTDLEKLTFAYDIIKSFYYKEVSEDENKKISRNIHSIIETGNIVCVGYAKFLSQLLEELGIESYAISANTDKYGHQRNLVRITDDKYGIDGVYSLDPTWDCAHGLVKYINEEGKEEIKENKRLNGDEVIIKKFDDLCLYRYFLIPGSKFEQVFSENKPNIERLDSFDELKTGVTVEDVTNEFLNSESIDKEKFIELITKVRLCEGYTPDSIDQIISDILEINKLAKEKTENISKG